MRDCAPHALTAAISSGVGKLFHSCTCPPSTTKDAPFTKLAAWDARKTIAAACKQASKHKGLGSTEAVGA